MKHPRRHRTFDHAPVLAMKIRFCNATGKVRSVPDDWRLCGSVVIPVFPLFPPRIDTRRYAVRSGTSTSGSATRVALMLGKELRQREIQGRGSALLANPISGWPNSNCNPQSPIRLLGVLEYSVLLVLLDR